MGIYKFIYKKLDNGAMGYFLGGFWNNLYKKVYMGFIYKNLYKKRWFIKLVLFILIKISYFIGGVKWIIE